MQFAHGLNNSNTKQIKIGNYILGSTIGKGNSAVVKIATHSLTLQKVAIKIFDKSVLDIEKQERLKREIESMKRLKHHNNIIKLYEIMETAKLICLVTEYASNGELYDYIIFKKRLSEREAKIFFKQIVASVHYCHSNKIVHRDLKVENLLLDSNWKIKLADFGFSSQFKPNELLDVYCGSPPYSAPELYLAKMYDGPKVDIWSLGVILFVLVCGYLPFESNHLNVLRSQIINGSYKLPFFLTDGMLTIDPTKRFSLNDIINHKWLKNNENNNFPNLLHKNEYLEAEIESYDYEEFKNLIDKIENISIKEIIPNEYVISEISNRYNLNKEDILKSLLNNEFDSIAGIYYLTEDKLFKKQPKSDFLGNNLFIATSFINKNESIHAQNKYEYEDQIQNSQINSKISENSINTNKYIKENENETKTIEELGRDYLCRYNAIRRHTISSNNDNKQNDHFNKDNIINKTVVKECSNLLGEIKNLDGYLSDNEKLDLSQKVNIKRSKASIDYIVNSEYILKDDFSSNDQPKFNFDKESPSIENNYNSINQTNIVAQNLDTLKNNQINDLNFFNKSTLKKHSHFHHQNHHYNFNNQFYNKCIRSRQCNSNMPTVINKNNNQNYTDPLTNQFTSSYLLHPTNNNGRRASDGGSNISLFNKLYGINYNQENNISYNESKNDQQETNFINENKEYFDHNFRINNNNDVTTQDYLLSKRKIRGSITSGKSILNNSNFSCTKQNEANEENDLNNDDNRINFFEKCDENDNFVDKNNNQMVKYQRRSSIKGRHEPYYDNQSQNLYNNLSEFTTTQNTFNESCSKIKNSSKFRLHRASEPNQIDVLFANRSHLEKIYNQSILDKSKSILALNEELKYLQQENSIENYKTKLNEKLHQENEMGNFFNEIIDHNDVLSSNCDQILNEHILNVDDLKNSNEISLKMNSESLKENCKEEHIKANLTSSQPNSSSALQIIQEEQINDINMNSQES